MKPRSERWFWFTLALALGQTVSELQSKMSRVEFNQWKDFYHDQPFDDLHRFHRPAAMVASAMSGKYQERLDFLQPPTRRSEADLNTMRAFGFSRI